MKAIILLIFIFCHNIFAETSEVVDIKKIEAESNEHKIWLSQQLADLSRFAGANENSIKILLSAESAQLEISNYFEKHRKRMTQSLRIEYRSLIDMYLLAIPTAEVFDSSDCHQYRTRFFTDAGQDKANWTWTAKVPFQVLDKVCPGSIPKS